METCGGMWSSPGIFFETCQVNSIELMLSKYERSRLGEGLVGAGNFDNFDNVGFPNPMACNTNLAYSFSQHLIITLIGIYVITLCVILTSLGNAIGGLMIAYDVPLKPQLRTRGVMH